MVVEEFKHPLSALPPYRKSVDISTGGSGTSREDSASHGGVAEEARGRAPLYATIISRTKRILIHARRIGPSARAYFCDPKRTLWRAAYSNQTGERAPCSGYGALSILETLHAKRAWPIERSLV